jgi:hypothetical protein
MTMSDPFLPVPPEEVADLRTQRELEDLENDRQPDLLRGIPEEHSPEEVAAAEHADQPGRFRTPHPGDRLTPAELEAELG